MGSISKEMTQEEKENLYSLFNWFDEEIGTKICNACCNFWENKLDICLYSITKSDAIKNDFVSKNESYYTHKVQMDSRQNTVFRLSSGFVQTFLHVYLGSSSPKFNLFELSELEVKILNAFIDYLYKTISKNFVPYKDVPKNIQIDKGNYNLTFLVRKNGFKSSKITISIPRNAVVPKEIVKKVNFLPESFDKIPIYVDLRAGITKLKLSDLSELAREDIVLLEDSDVSKITVKNEGFEIDFKISPDPGLIMDLDTNEHDIAGGNMSRNVWDDIQIEVSAEFKKVKMTLGELKQITKGMVIDLGDIFNNKIFMVVEDKIVAKGELVIINDKYGVKIDEVISENNPATATPIKPSGIRQKIEQQIKATHQTPKPQPKKEETATEEENFDYSDFEDKEGK
jgi:flagellar motor switch/type III secretory pathway protein FliN